MSHLAKATQSQKAAIRIACSSMVLNIPLFPLHFPLPILLRGELGRATQLLTLGSFTFREGWTRGCQVPSQLIDSMRWQAQGTATRHGACPECTILLHTNSHHFLPPLTQVQLSPLKQRYVLDSVLGLSQALVGGCSLNSSKSNLPSWALIFSLRSPAPPYATLSLITSLSGVSLYSV